MKIAVLTPPFSGGRELAKKLATDNNLTLKHYSLMKFPYMNSDVINTVVELSNVEDNTVLHGNAQHWNSSESEDLISILNSDFEIHTSKRDAQELLICTIFSRHLFRGGKTQEAIDFYTDVENSNVEPFEVILDEDFKSEIKFAVSSYLETMNMFIIKETHDYASFFPMEKDILSKAKSLITNLEKVNQFINDELIPLYS